nr:hypothetical protein BJQ95_02959 [Cryobacterium sp. SO1]
MRGTYGRAPGIRSDVSDALLDRSAKPGGDERNSCNFCRAGRGTRRITGLADGVWEKLQEL